jgi:hypothetical protein
MVILCLDIFHNLYSSPNIIIRFQSRRIRLAGHVACMRGEGECKWDFGGNARRKETVRET